MLESKFSEQGGCTPTSRKAERVPDCNALLHCVVNRVADCTRCLDLGAGTGHATLKLLESRQDRVVWVIESNHSVIQQLLSEVDYLEGTMGAGFFGSLCIWREDLMRLDDCPEFLAPGTYDSAILTNVVSAVLSTRMLAKMWTTFPGVCDRHWKLRKVLCVSS